MKERTRDDGRPRRLGILIPGFSSSEDDWCLPFASNLVRELARGDDVRVFALRHPPLRARYRVHGAEVITFGDDDGTPWGRLRRWRRTVRTIREEHAKRPFDLLHGIWAHEPGALAVRAAGRIDVPAVVTVAGSELAHIPALSVGGGPWSPNAWLSRYSLARATLVTAVSDFAIRPRRGLVGAERLEILPLGTDTRLFFPAPAERLEGSPSLLNVASLLPVKGHDVLLETLVRVRQRHPEVVLHLVGTGPCRARLEELAARANLAENVRFHGDVGHEGLPAIYRGADLFVLSSHSEGQCLAAIESLACGTPVAGTAVGTLPDVVPPAHLSPVGDPEALARAVESALAAPREDRAGLLRSGRGFSLEESLERWRRTYDRAVSRGTTANGT